MLLLVAALSCLMLISESVLASNPPCPCSLQEAGSLMLCEGWADWCPRDPLPSINLTTLVITASPALSTINISNINTQDPGMDQL